MFETAASLDLNFNINKSHCISFGKSAALKIDPMKIGSCEVAWCSNIKYLGVYIVSGKRISFDIDPIKRAFYSACNCVFLMQKKWMSCYIYLCRRLFVYQFYYMPLLAVHLKRGS
jgi:hypothetical protein